MKTKMKPIKRKFIRKNIPNKFLINPNRFSLKANTKYIRRYYRPVNTIKQDNKKLLLTN